MAEMRVLSAIDRVFPIECPEHRDGVFTMLRNEPLDLQIAYRLNGDEGKTRRVLIRVEADLPVNVYSLSYVPVRHTDTVGLPGTPAPGLFGDMLLPKRRNPKLVERATPWGSGWYEEGEETLLNACNDCWQVIWLAVNEHAKTVRSGDRELEVRLLDADTLAVLAERTVRVHIVRAKLPEQKLIYTNWFHCDCLCDYYGVEMFSDRFFDIFADYVEKAARNGMNMLLLPAFTPPLDTAIGYERMTAQLVRVTKQGSAYSFDFSLMERYIRIAMSAGIRWFEHSHLFTQWGAEAAPKIVATVNGKEKRIFGWDTKASGKAYTLFLRQYIPAVREFLRGMGLEDKTLFHISDEPQAEHTEGYAAAKKTVAKLLEGCMQGDALSDYPLYEAGLVQLPICATDAIGPFLGKCEHLWAYYTGAQVDGYSNRMLVMPPERNRMLGIQLYRFRVEGFLQWGYNYYYDWLSRGLYDPKIDPCAYRNNGGGCYFVYPGRKGEALQSARQKVFAQAILDMRVLEALEKRKGRRTCEELIYRHFGDIGFRTVPDSPDAVLRFREEVNAMLDEK